MEDAMDIDPVPSIKPPKSVRNGTANKLKAQYSFNQLQQTTDRQQVAQPRVLSSTGQESKTIKRLSRVSYDTNDEQNKGRSSETPPVAQPTSEAGMVAVDLGDYDGGLEAENLVRGEVVYGEAANSLALNSSHSR
jgi:hypothetical protein